jgi:hypothetical protein
MTISTALSSLKSAIAAFPAEKVTPAEIEDFLERARGSLRIGRQMSRNLTLLEEEGSRENQSVD